MIDDGARTDLDPDNPVVALCAAGMALEGDSAAAAACFARAWAARRDDIDAAVAAHYLARHRPTAASRLRWNALAARHAEAAQRAGDGRAGALLASLYLNLGDGLLAAGRCTAAREMAVRAEAALTALPDGGYRAFVAGGISRLRERIDVAPSVGA